jgi:glutathione S-transferase
MKLYNGNLSPNALRSRSVVYELGADIEIVEVDMRAGAHKAPDYLKLNMNGKVPVLVDGDFVIWESRAINAYLASAYPAKGLYPADLKKRAVIDQWSYWHAIHLGPAMQRVAFERIQKAFFGRGAPDEAVIAAEMKSVDLFMPVFEAALGDGRDWIAGDLSIADFSLASTFIYRVGAGISLDAYPKVAAWIARMESRPSWKRALVEMPPMPQPKAA